MRQGILLEVGDLRVERDRYCYIVQRNRVITQGKNKGLKRWVNLGYYGTLRGLARRLLEEEVGLRLDVELLKYSEALDEAADRLAASWNA